MSPSNRSNPRRLAGGGADSVEVSTFLVLGMRWSEIDSYLQDRDLTPVPAGRRFPTPRTRNAPRPVIVALPTTKVSRCRLPPPHSAPLVQREAAAALSASKATGGRGRTQFHLRTAFTYAERRPRPIAPSIHPRTNSRDLSGRVGAPTRDPATNPISFFTSSIETLLQTSAGVDYTSTIAFRRYR